MKDYHVALSFAGEQRDYVQAVATKLTKDGVLVFYDDFNTVTLWGKNLQEYFHEIYRDKAHFIVMFISKAYKEKAWPTHERRSAQERALMNKNEYILPVVVDDDIDIPGLYTTIGHVRIQNLAPDDLAEMIIQKLIEAKVYFPLEHSERVINESKRDTDFMEKLQEPTNPKNGYWDYVAYFSHTYHDDPFLEPIRRFFQKCKYQVFSHYSRYKPGDPFSVLVDAIERSKYFYYFVGKVEDDFERRNREIEVAFHCLSRREIDKIIPVILPEGSRENVPLVLKNIKPVDLRANYVETGFRELIRF